MPDRTRNETRGPEAPPMSNQTTKVADDAKAINLPVEENDFDAQPQ